MSAPCISLARYCFRALTVVAVLAATFATGAARAQGDPAIVGQWAPVQEWPSVAVHTHLLPTGKVMFYSYGDDPRLWDPGTGLITSLPRVGYNIFCTSHSYLADGRLLILGGHVENGWGRADASLYEPLTRTWLRLPAMNNGRWYPTSTTLANGDVLVVSGSYDTNYTNNTLPQVWQTNSHTWRDLTNAHRHLPLYPFMFLAPSGKVFIAGPTQATGYLHTGGRGAWTHVAHSLFGYRDYGTAVLYSTGRVLLIGGHDPPTASAEAISLNATTPAWRAVAPMAIPRRQHNATILPDGRVLVTGGSSGPGFNNRTFPVFPAEMWDPATEKWRTLASNTRYRGYHSTALLLPDGRVLSAGGDDERNAEVFSPPYLFKGARPTITEAPAEIIYGRSFFVGTPDAATINHATLLRLPSVTHAFDQEQRIVRLPLTRETGGVRLTPPTAATLCPPGYYMLFVLKNTGVPSVARIVRIDRDQSQLEPAPTNLTATAVSSSQIDLAWTDNSASETRFRIEHSANAVHWIEATTVGPNVTAWSQQNLAPATVRHYRVRALGAAVSPVYTNWVVAKTSG